VIGNFQEADAKAFLEQQPNAPSLTAEDWSVVYEVRVCLACRHYTASHLKQSAYALTLCCIAVWTGLWWKCWNSFQGSNGIQHAHNKWQLDCWYVHTGDTFLL
jgi:hypothetical protein